MVRNAVKKLHEEYCIDYFGSQKKPIVEHVYLIDIEIKEIAPQTV